MSIAVINKKGNKVLVPHIVVVKGYKAVADFCDKEGSPKTPKVAELVVELKGGKE